MKWFWPLLIPLLMEPSHGNTLIVDPYGSGEIKAISRAVFLAQDGDTILVKPGEYEGILIDRTLRIIGSNGTDCVIKSNCEENAIRINALGCVIENLTLIGTSRNQVLAVESLDNLIQRCTLTGSMGGIVREDNNTIEECQMDCEIGMELICSSGIILNGTFHGNEDLSIKNSSLNEVNNCNFLTQTGMELISSSRNVLADNYLNGQGFGIVLSESTENWIEHNNISGLYFSGIDVLASNGNNISQNHLISCKLDISLRGSHNNSLADNLCINNERAGIYSNGSSNNDFLENEFTDNGNGILLANSVFNLLDGNRASDNMYGFFLRDSARNEFRNNFLDANNYNMRIDSDEISSACLTSSSFESYIQDIDRSNMGDQKPICHLAAKSNIQVTDKCGFICLIGCSNVTVQNQNISNSTIGILIVNSTSCNVMAGNIHQSEVGIKLADSSDFKITGTAATNCLIGFLTTESDDGVFQNNTAWLQGGWFEVMDSSNLNLISSRVNNSGKGISFSNSLLCNLVNCSSRSNRDEGITLLNPHKCLLARNEVEQNSQGLIFMGSNACVILNNIFNENKLDGLVLSQLSEAELIGNKRYC